MSMVYPGSGNKRILTSKETARTAIKMPISRFAVKLNPFPLRFLEDTCSLRNKNVFQNQPINLLSENGMNDTRTVKIFDKTG